MVLSKDDELILEKLWYDTKSNSSFSGVQKLFNNVKLQGHNISLEKIKDWLKYNYFSSCRHMNNLLFYRAQPTYTLWKNARRRYPRNSINATFPGEIMEFDLADMQNNTEIDSSTNLCIKFLAIAVDSFSRFTFCIPLPGRSSKNITEAIQAILDTNYLPEKCLLDPAGEHVSKVTQKWFKSKGIHAYFTTSIIHCPRAERFIRSWRQYIRRYQHANNTDKWLKATVDNVKQYNNTIRRMHNEKPAEILKSPTVAARAFRKLYGSKVITKQTRKLSKSAPSVNSLVRVSRVRLPFEKESTFRLDVNFSRPSVYSLLIELFRGLWSREVYKVTKVDGTKKQPVVALKDLKNRHLPGKFYLQEVQVVKVPSEALYEIHKVIKTRTRNGVKESLVQWKGYRKVDATWIKQSEIKKLTKNKLDKTVH